MTTTTKAATEAAAPAPDAEQALARAVAHLRSLQAAEGYWKGELETNVTMDAEDLLLRQFLGIRQPQETEEAARWIRSQQRPDGTWANFFGGPADVSTTAESWVALRLAGDDPSEPWMRAAAEYVRSQGGIERTRVFTRIWLALFGLWSWDDLPVMPPELIFLPKWAPLNVYNWACWARQTIVPLTIVGSQRPVRPIGFDIEELRTHAAPPPLAPLLTWKGFFGRADKVLHAYEKRPIRWLRRAATKKAVQWILDRQEADGSWGGIQPPWVYSLMALDVSGYSVDDRPVQRGLRGLDGFTIREQTPEGVVRRLEACQSPVWDTALALIGMLDAGVPGDDPDVQRAAEWTLREEIRVKGDWAVRRPDLAPGGWAFEFDNDGYPDTDDTAEVVLALRRCIVDDQRALRAAIDRGMAWAVGMQSSDGGWGAFDADNTSELALKLPFCDFGAVIDPPSADVTAHIVEMLAAEGRADSEACLRGVRWLLDSQEPDGSWFGRWGANYVYGTGAAVPALVLAGLSPSDPVIRAAVRWLEGCQNADGGWGEDLRSYDDPAGWSGKGESTPSQTAWALMALHAAGERSPASERGIAWLVDNQRDDGSWDEKYFTGTGFPGDFYLNYHLYRVVWPISALGRYVRTAP